MSQSIKSVQEHILPNIEDWPIYKLAQNRSAFVHDIVKSEIEDYAHLEKAEIEELLSRTIYLELKRIKEEPYKVDPRGEEKFFKKLRQDLKDLTLDNNASIEKYQALLNKLVHRYAEEIVGNFKKRTFKFARKALTMLFKWLLISFRSSKRKTLFRSNYDLYQKLTVRGPLEKIRTLAKDHTIVMLPTHFSNLDSILIGYAIDSIMGLPAFMYGAGLNLFEMEIAAYFMNRLGAYRIDRRKKNPIYLSTLKKMSFISLKNGVHTLFYPGGTRSRSGELEYKLKIGLIETIVKVQRSIYEEGKNNKIVIVPLVLSYHSVLESKFMIEQYLRKTGQELYFAGKDGGRSYLNMMQFIWKLMSSDSEVCLTLGQPMDVFGYAIDINGVSLDNKSNPINIKEYFMLDGTISANAQRERVYTLQLAKKIVESYHVHNTVLSSHIVAFAAFTYIKKLFKDDNIYTLVSRDIDKIKIKYKDFYCRVERLVAIILQMSGNGKIHVSDQIRVDNIDEIITRGIKYLGSFHNQKPLAMDGDGNIITDDLKLLYYYNNRLMHYDIEARMNAYHKMGTHKQKVKA